MKKFFDDKNFPYGFDRHGIFTKKESQALEDFGTVIVDLKNKTAPKNEFEKNLIRFLNGERAAESELERAWEKYTKEINKHPIKMFLGKGGGLGCDEDEFEITHATQIPRGYMTKRQK